MPSYSLVLSIYLFNRFDWSFYAVVKNISHIWWEETQQALEETITIHP